MSGRVDRRGGDGANLRVRVLRLVRVAYQVFL